MFGFTSTTQVTHSQCQPHPLPVSRSFACSPTRLVNRFQSKGCRCAPMRSRQSCAIMYHGERCSSCRNATCVASTALRFLAPRRRLAAGSIVASKHASVARLIHNMRVGEASDVVRRAVRRGGGVRSPESALRRVTCVTSDRDFVVDFFSPLSSFRDRVCAHRGQGQIRRSQMLRAGAAAGMAAQTEGCYDRVKSRNKKYNTHSPKDLITPAGAARARHSVASL